MKTDLASLAILNWGDMKEIKLSDPSLVFVFGSNTRGIHGAGAALVARNHFGAVLRQGVGLHGRAYAIPTKLAEVIKFKTVMTTLPVAKIIPEIAKFIEYAKSSPDKQFLVTRVGCGLAGLKDAEIARYFKDAPSNCLLPVLWNDLNGCPSQEFELTNDIGLAGADFGYLNSNYRKPKATPGFKF